MKARGTDPSSLLPDTPYNPPTTTPFPLTRAKVNFWGVASGEDETNSFGYFSVPGILGNPTIEIQAQCLNSDFHIVASQGPTVLDHQSGLASQYYTLRLNETPSELTTSQINAFVWTQKSRAYADSLYAIANLSVPHRFTWAYVNFVSTNDLEVAPCGARYHFPSNQFWFPKSGQSFSVPEGQINCVNMAYSTVVAHEYGHHVQREMQIAVEYHSFSAGAGANYEGSADVFATYLTEQPIIGQDRHGTGTFVRDLSVDIVFPTTSSDAHFIGRTLAGSFWDLFVALRDSPVGGTSIARSFYIFYMNDYFFNKSTPEEIDERVGERLELIDLSKYGGYYKQFIINAFVPHNLYRLNFVRGDVNGDGYVGYSDVVALSDYLDDGYPVPGCLDACDMTNDNQVNTSDTAYLVSHLYYGYPPPVAPYPTCGRDPVGGLGGGRDHLTCLQSPCPQ